jgi:hypothetical protein
MPQNAVTSHYDAVPLSVRHVGECAADRRRAAETEATIRPGAARGTRGAVAAGATEADTRRRAANAGADIGAEACSRTADTRGGAGASRGTAYAARRAGSASDTAPSDATAHAATDTATDTATNAAADAAAAAAGTGARAAAGTERHRATRRTECCHGDDEQADARRPHEIVECNRTGHFRLPKTRIALTQARVGCVTTPDSEKRLRCGQGVPRLSQKNSYASFRSLHVVARD